MALQKTDAGPGPDARERGIFSLMTLLASKFQENMQEFILPVFRPDATQRATQNRGRECGGL
jgi:hypothetical protein